MPRPTHEVQPFTPAARANFGIGMFETEPDELHFEALDMEHEVLGTIASTYRNDRVRLAEELHQ